MRDHRRTLSAMDIDQTDRLLAFLCDVVLAQGGDWDATEAILRSQFTGDQREIAYGVATVLLIQYEEPGGPAFLRGMLERRRRLVPTVPAGSRWRPFRATG